MRPLPTPSSPWLKAGITWLAYSVSGLLAMTLAAPGSYVSPLYLAAGVGLGLVLGWGHAMLGAVALGSATVVLVAHYILKTPVAHWIVLSQALVCASGAALQAWVGAKLVQPGKALDLPLDRLGQVVRFLILAGPVACLVNASISVPAMQWLGLLPPEAALPAGIQWWAGDTLGVLVSTPLVLTLVGRPTELWRARLVVVGIPLLASTVLLAMGILHIHRWDQERENASFERDVDTARNAVNLHLNSYLSALEALHGLYTASRQVDREEFARASQYWLHTLKGIQALGWDERISRDQLPSFEMQQRLQGMPRYQVFDLVADGREQHPVRGQDIIALRFIEPLQGNERALGFNVLSTDITRSAIDQARREDRAVATRGFQLVQEPEQKEAQQKLGVVIYRPVYDRSTHSQADRMRATKGAVFMALRMDDTLASMLNGLPAYLSACLLEDSGPPPERRLVRLGGQASCLASSPNRYRRLMPITFAGQQWYLAIWANRAIPIVGRGTTSWFFAAGGVLLAAALGTMLLVVSGHTSRIEGAVEEARAQRQAAESANRAKSEFLSRMSHELRTPLNAVLGFAQVMDMDQDSPLPPTQHQRLKQIQQAGWHLLDMIDDVLDISRIDTGTLRLNSELVSVAQVVEQTCRQAKDQATNLGVTLMWPAEIPASWGVWADPVRLRQTLQALLDNGVTYNHRDGTVTVEVKRVAPAKGAPQIVISVKDTGMGMGPEQLSQLFQPFNRLGRDKQVPDGAGVSLVICKHLAMLMGGDLQAVSTPGQGAMFTLSLPAEVIATASAHSANKTAAELAPPLPPHARHVLYVEDNLANSEVIKAALGARPWIQVSVAPTFEQGLSALHNRMLGPKPDLILLDVHLPDASGQEFLRLIKANPDTSAIPVIVISADAMPEQIDQALSSGAACYLTKPVQLPSLLTQVDDLLGLSGASASA